MENINRNSCFKFQLLVLYLKFFSFRTLLLMDYNFHH